MINDAKELLDLCTERFPSPRPSQHHNLTVIDGTMVLTLMQGDTYQSFSLTSVDLCKEPAALVEELAALLSTLPVDPPGPNAGLVPPIEPPDDAA